MNFPLYIHPKRFAVLCCYWTLCLVVATTYQFTIAPTSFNPYIIHTVNNMDFIITLNQKKKDWMKKYHKIIQGLEIIANLQLQIQNLVKLADIANNQLANIKTILLQTREIHKIQISGDIYNIFKKLKNIIHRDIERQAHYIQVLLADELD